MMSGQSPYHTMTDELSMDIDNNDLSLYSSDLASCKQTLVASDLNMHKPELVSQEIVVDDHSSQLTGDSGDLEQFRDDVSGKTDRSGEESDYVVELELDQEDSNIAEATSQKVYTVLEPAGRAWGGNKGAASEESMDSGFGSQDDRSVASRHSFTSLLTQDNETIELRSWLSKHPDHWTSGEVLDWVYDVAEEENIDTSQLRGEAFSEVDGPTLCSWSQADFIKADPQYGVAIYEQFRTLCGMTGELLPPEEVTEQTGYDHQRCVNPLMDDIEDGSSPIRGIDPYLPQGAMVERTVQIGGRDYTIDPKDAFEDITAINTTLSLTSATQAGIHTSISHCSGGLVRQLAQSTNLHSTTIKGLPLQTTGQQTVIPKEHANTQIKPSKRGRGRPRKNLPSVEEGGSDGEYTPYKKTKPGTGQRGGPRGKRPHSNRMLHLWEFIRDLLLDSQYNPSLIRWENRREGVFRVIRSKDVARMWGVRKQNPDMTYEKFSRSMRFCRTAGYFGEVPKDGKYPKKLCFAFGERAHGWQPNSVISNCFYQKL